MTSMLKSHFTGKSFNRRRNAKGFKSKKILKTSCVRWSVNWKISLSESVKL
jgi:hypothetical protein